MTKITCDRCGARIAVFPFMQQKFPVLTIVSITGPHDPTKTIDLCDECKRDFVVWVDAGKAASKEVPEDYDIEVGDL